jgi:AraC-like DNA-binding protein
VSWEEIAVELACRILELGEGAFHPPRVPLQAEARVTDAVRAIDRRPSAPWSLETLARGTGLSPFHFLRTFERVAGVTPHQYVRRARLREAAVRLATEPSRVLDLALASGFGDVSNFNRAFRTEFSASPRAIRNSWQER